MTSVNEQNTTGRFDTNTESTLCSMAQVKSKDQTPQTYLRAGGWIKKRTIKKSFVHASVLVSDHMTNAPIATLKKKQQSS